MEENPKISIIIKTEGNQRFSLSKGTRYFPRKFENPFGFHFIRLGARASSASRKIQFSFLLADLRTCVL
jgi:hypothetical protein